MSNNCYGTHLTLLKITEIHTSKKEVNKNARQAGKYNVKG